MLAGLHVLTIPASRPLPFALGGVLAPARTEVLVLRVTSARVGIGSAAQEGRAAHAQGRKFTAWGSHHDGRDERGQYNIVEPVFGGLWARNVSIGRRAVVAATREQDSRV